MNEPILPALDAHTDQKTEFFMAASHQLKSPVAVVQWCLNSITEKQDIDPETRKLAERALVQADAMSQLLGDMLRVFRIIHKGHGVETLVPINMNHLLEGVLKQYELIALQQQVKIQVGPMEQLPLVLGNETYLQQAVINILDNAIKYSTAGSSVELSAYAKGGMIEITIADHGIGIPEAEQSRLFTEFFRGELAKDKTANGTGLGLVLVKHILEGMGGGISYTSVPGRGTTFLLRIPTAAA
ncbi:MAG TPA: HAMP domain-containing sensor histidine kinase [Verrucomicrobiae bacterium]|nr:HAMP domain-containing sensor histidine kinase [Verrucomicrobiae bacterium]